MSSFDEHRVLRGVVVFSDKAGRVVVGGCSRVSEGTVLSRVILVMR